MNWYNCYKNISMMNSYSTNQKQGLVSSAALAWALKNTTWVTLVDYQLEVDKGSLQLCHSKSEKTNVSNTSTKEGRRASGLRSPENCTH